MRQCPRCGNDTIRPEAKFCDMCGARLPAAAKPPIPARGGTTRVAGRPAGERVRPEAGRATRAPGRSLTPAAGSRSPRRPPRRLVSPVPKGPSLTWEDVFKLPDMADELNIKGIRWVKVDELELRNRESEAAHDWSINETRHVFQERGTRRYPDGTEVSCRGYLHKGGFARFTIHNLAPRAPVVMVRRVWAEGMEVGEVFVGEYTAGAFKYTEIDLETPLRNRIHTIPGSLVQGDTLTVEQEDLGSEKGLYYFKIWFYQPGHAVDSRVSDEARARATSVGGKARVLPEGVPTSWDKLRKTGKVLPERVKILDKEWLLVDHMAFAEADSPDNHSFAVYDAKNYFTINLRSTYPDGETVEDSGIRWEEGLAEWTVGGTMARRDMMILVRMDYKDGGQEVRVVCDERPAGVLEVEGRDPLHRWRNWTFRVPGRLVSEGTARIKFELDEGVPGMNMFRLWFYQQR